MAKMEHIPEQTRPGITALKLPADIAHLVAQADNLMITPNGAVEKGQLQTQEHRHVTVFELPRTDKKLAMVHEFMKKLFRNLILRRARSSSTERNKYSECRIGSRQSRTCLSQESASE
ncbi:hypothetical protein CNYM01_11259 [Colletotrichum nymphaeae SA-01]|uniref:Uncharacterized protein n=1 Tax=Colletotrichum nymphaeae SA-01 TaxID=1460502 RepID=A0A135RY97_9PEZI|nr:hypothetical protein CNYM01_11259 [Colletotrichum nymphaeae SA-01]